MTTGDWFPTSRRRFLACCGLATIAGCTGGSRDGNDSDEDGASDENDDADPDDGATEDGDRSEEESSEGSRTVDVDGEWPAFGFDARNTGYDDRVTAPRSEPTRAWESNVDGVYTLSAPAVGDGVICAGSDEFAYAFSLEDGSPVWEQPVDYLAHHFPPAIADGSVYLSTRTLEGEFSGGGAGALYAFDVEDGTTQWTLEDPFSSPVTPIDDELYVAKNFRTESVISALDSANGDPLWERTIDEGYAQTNVVSAPAVTDEVVYATVGTRGESSETTGGLLLALSRSDGSELWRVAADERVYGAPVVGEDAVFFADQYGTVRSIDRRTGDERWTATTDDEVWTTPVTDGDAVYVLAEDHVVKFDAETGDRSYKTHVGETLINGLVVGEETVYTGGTYVNSLDKETGEVEWQYPVPAEAGGGFGAPVALDGTVFVGACLKSQNTSMYDDYIYALN